MPPMAAPQAALISSRDSAAVCMAEAMGPADLQQAAPAAAPEAAALAPTFSAQASVAPAAAQPAAAPAPPAFVPLSFDDIFGPPRISVPQPPAAPAAAAPAAPPPAAAEGPSQAPAGPGADPLPESGVAGQATQLPPAAAASGELGHSGSLPPPPQDPSQVPGGQSVEAGSRPSLRQRMAMRRNQG